VSILSLDWRHCIVHFGGRVSFWRLDARNCVVLPSVSCNARISGEGSVGWGYIFGFFVIFALDMLAKKHYETHHQSEVVIMLFVAQLLICVVLFIYYLLED
jgi:hypothetical protein